MEMKKLVVNGVAYTVADPDAASIDDTKVGADAWSGKHIVDRLCPAFSESGALVTCQPVEGYPLGVVSRIEPVQSGSGDPSPENIRPITGHSAVTVTRNGEEFTFDLGQTVYGGSLDWQTGVLTVTWKQLILDGTERWWLYSNDKDQYSTFFHTSCFYISLQEKKIGYPNVLCSCFKNTNNADAFTPTKAESGMFTGHPTVGNVYFTWGEVHQTVEQWTAWLAERYASGTPVEIAYELAEPITIQLTPHEILALSGTNTLHSDTGDTEVTGRADLQSLLQRLMEVANA